MKATKRLCQKNNAHSITFPSRLLDWNKQNKQNPYYILLFWGSSTLGKNAVKNLFILSRDTHKPWKTKSSLRIIHQWTRPYTDKHGSCMHQVWNFFFSFQEDLLIIFLTLYILLYARKKMYCRGMHPVLTLPNLPNMLKKSNPRVTRYQTSLVMPLSAVRTTAACDATTYLPVIITYFHHHLR